MTHQPQHDRQPRRLERLKQAAWDRHPDRDVLLELRKRRDAKGKKAWIEVTKPDPDDAGRTELWLQPLPAGRPILIGSWRTADADPPGW